MRKKKIIYVITKSFWGGAQRYVYDLAVNLAEENFEAAVVTGEEGLLTEKLKEAGIKTVSQPSLKRDIGFFSEIKSFIFLYKFFRLEKPDVVHINSSKAGALGILAARFAGVKNIIFTAHGWPFNEDRHPLVRLIFKLIMWFAMMICDKIIAVSENVAITGQSMPFLAEKFVLIYNGVKKTEIFSRDKSREFFFNKWPRLKDLPEKTVWIGTISELTKNKGVEYAVKALASIKDLPFIFLIIGEGELKEQLEKLIKELHLEEKVFLFGYLKEAQKYLPALDIFTLTSLTEALAYVAMEAGCASLPVVATRVGGLPEIIENKKSGFLAEPKNPGQISAALKELIKNEDLRKEFGGNLKKTIEEKFVFEEMLKKTFALYN